MRPEAGTLRRLLGSSRRGHPDADANPIADLRLVPVAAAAWATAIIAIRLGPIQSVLASVLLLCSATLIAATLRPRRNPSGPGRYRQTRRRLARRRSAHVRESTRQPATRRARQGWVPGRGSWARAAGSVAATLGVSAIVFASAAAALQSRVAGPIGGAIERGDTVVAELEITAPPRPAVTRDRYTGQERVTVEARIVAASVNGIRFDADTPVLIIGGAEYARLVSSERIRTAGTLLPANRADTIAALFIAENAPHRLAGPNEWQQGTAHLRSEFRRAASDLPAGGKALLPGMVLGDRSSVGDDLDTAMKETGLSHLTAVSGTNCGIVLGFVFLLLNFARMPRWVRAMIAVALLGLFVSVVRPDPSVLRAAVMGGIGVVAVVTGRGKHAASLLFITVTVLLAIDPWLAGSFAFCLSVAATAGLLFAGPPCTRLLARVMPWPLALAIAVPLTAQACCAPILILLAPRLSTYAVPANMLVAPVVPAVTIIGLTAVCVLVLVPAAAVPLVTVSGWGANWVAVCAHFFADLPAATLPWMSGAAGAGVLAAGTAAAALVLSRFLRARDPHTSQWLASRQPGSGQPGSARAGRRPGRPGGARRLLVPLCLGAAAGVLPAALIASTPPAPSATATWEVAACDVGQGDGLVVRTGVDRAMVIDTGPDPAIMETCLNKLGIRTVDLLVISHMHADHYGGTAGVLEGRSVTRAVVSSASPELPPRLARLLAAHGVPVTFGAAGAHGRAGPVTWRALWPPRPVATSPPGQNAGSGAPNSRRPASPGPGYGEAPGVYEPTSTEENNASLVLRMSIDEPGGPDLTVLLTGDLQRHKMRRLLQAYPRLGHERLDVLKVAHHGARNGGTAVIRTLDPAVAVISVGADNDYGHPGSSILRALRSAGVVVGRTDTDGRIYLAKTGTSILMWDQR